MGKEFKLSLSADGIAVYLKDPILTFLIILQGTKSIYENQLNEIWFKSVTLYQKQLKAHRRP